jgi:hypothetical protein
MTGIWNECFLHISRSETHHRRHHYSERRSAANRQLRRGELAFSEICFVVDDVLAEGCELGEARTDGAVVLFLAMYRKHLLKISQSCE